MNEITRNRIATCTLVLAKLSGITGMALGFTPFHTVGWFFLGAAGFLIMITMALCVYRAIPVDEVSVVKQSAKDSFDIQVIQRLMREGKLNDYLNEAGFVKED